MSRLIDAAYCYINQVLLWVRYISIEKTNRSERRKLTMKCLQAQFCKTGMKMKMITSLL